MKNLYNLGSKTIRQSIISIRRHAENCMMHNSLCRLVAVLLLSVGAFSYAQADTTTHDDVTPGVTYDVWDGSYNQNLSSLARTADGYYRIRSAKDLATMFYYLAGSHRTDNFRLEVDVDMSAHDFSMFNTTKHFKGTFDGGGHYIYGVSSFARSNYDTASYGGRYGFFRSLGENSAATIKNFTLVKPYLRIESSGTNSNDNHYYGIIAGKVCSPSVVENINVINPIIYVSAPLQKTCYISTGVAMAQANAQIRNIKVTDPKIYFYETATLTNNPVYVGGAVGYAETNTAPIENILVANPVVATAGTHSISKGQKFAFGGVVGFLSSNGKSYANASYLKNCAVTDGDIDFTGFQPATLTNLRFNKFAVGGVIGIHDNPYRYSENLFFSGKITAPYAYVAPCMALEYINDSWEMVTDHYAGVVRSESARLDQVERSKSATWYYNNFKIGLSSELLSAIDYTKDASLTAGTKKSPNFESGDIEVIGGKSFIDATRLIRHNRRLATPRASKTVLWWTRNESATSDTYATQVPASADFSDWTKGEQSAWPETNKDLSTYPAYFMYYAQGVNMGTQAMSSAAATSFTAGIKKNIEVAMGTATKNVTLNISNVSAEQRGFGDQTFEVAKDGDDKADVKSYQWIVGGEIKDGSLYTNTAKASFVNNRGWQTGLGISVVALDGSGNILAQANTYIPLGRFRIKNQAADVAPSNDYRTYASDPGTKEHPFLIGTEQDLRLLSELSRQYQYMPIEYAYIDGNKRAFRSRMQNDVTRPNYSMAYYEMDADVTLTNDEFWPIAGGAAPVYSADSNDGYANYALLGFMGVFDGKGHTISNMRQTWSSGYINEIARGIGWGLFTAIGGTGQYYKVGDATQLNAEVRNLNLSGFQLNAASDLRLKYKNANGSLSGNGNRLFVGTLAGVVGTYSTVENISVVGSAISDAAAPANYQIPSNSRFAVGGVYGRGQASLWHDYDGAASMSTTNVRYISSNTDIDISKAAFTNSTSAADQLRFGVGGIVGSIYSKGDQSSMAYPCPAFFGGKIKTPNAFAGPIFAIAENQDNRGTGFEDMPKHFTGKTSPSADFVATNMYYNYKVYDNTTRLGAAGYFDMNPTNYPLTTDWGDRNIKQVTVHNSGNVLSDGDQYEYQGDNGANYTLQGNAEVTNAFNDRSLAGADSVLIKEYDWGWEGGTVKLGGAGGDIYVSARDTYNGDSVNDHLLAATVNTYLTGEKHYQWYEKKKVYNVETSKWEDSEGVAISGATGETYKATQTLHNRYIYVRAWVGDKPEDEASGKNSDIIKVPKSQDFTATIDKSGDEASGWTITTNTTPAGIFTDTDADSGERTFSVTYQWFKTSVNSTPLAGEASSSLVVGASDDIQKTRYCVITITDLSAHSDYASENTYKLVVSKLPANRKVIYLNPSGVNGGAAGDDINDGLTKETAVKSWHKAYSLLFEDGTWDDNVIVLMSESDGERTNEGFMVGRNNRGNDNTDTYTNWYNDVTTGTDNSYAAEGYRSGMANSHMWKNTTITGKLDSSIDFTTTAKISFDGSQEHTMGLLGDTRFEHLTFKGNGSGYAILFCQYNNLEMGEGIISSYMKDDGDYGKVAGAHDADFQIFGGFCNDSRFRDDSGFLYSIMEGTMPNGKPWIPHGKEGFNINIKSGHFSVICTTHRQNRSDGQGIIGTPNLPIKCNINIDIDKGFNDEHKTCIGSSNNTNADYDIGLILAGNHEGAMYGDVNINVYSGRIGRIASGTLGHLRYEVASYGGYKPLNAYIGRANILLDPSLSRFAAADETSATKNARVIITELYGGGVGRSLGGKVSEVAIPFLGHTSITMNGGTFERIKSYNTSDPIFPGIFATGAGGINGMYHVAETVDNTGNNMASQRLPYWETNSTGQVLYGDWSTYDAHRDDQKVYVKCYDGYDIYTATEKYTNIDPEDAQTVVTINDGIFGTETDPLDGIYGGGSGYTPVVWMKNGDSAYPNYRSGNIYGKKDADHPVATLNINGGTFNCTNGVFAGGRGTDYYYKTHRNNNSSDSSKGEYYQNYTGLGQIFGDVELNITGGTFNCNVYGGGYGIGDVKYNNQEATNHTLSDMARIYGTTTVNITGGTINGNVYGGGAIANVGYGTSTDTYAASKLNPEITYYGTTSKNAITLNISGATITGKVFGAAEGRSSAEVASPDAVGNAYGNAELNITGGTIGDDIYGGAEKGDVYGNATTSINNASIAGDIYGGGLGVVSGETVQASADVTGSTNVTLGSGTTYSNETEHFLYGGGNLASVIGQYTKDGSGNVTGVTSGGNTTVNVNNGMGTSQLTVYGAGFGVNTACNMTNVNINNFATTKTVESVTKVIGLKDVFGGGNRGVVFTNTSVAMRGGQVLGDVFGGGNLAAVGTLAPSSYVIAGDAGYGNFGTTVALNSSNATVWGNIYGGGNQAAVGGLAQVNLTLGRFAGEVFGGGRGYMTDANTVGARADINGQTKVYVNGAKTIWNTLWDDSNKEFVTWFGGLTDTNWDRFINKSGTYPKFLNNHNIYGGGYLACTVTDSTRVEVTNGAVPADLIKLDVWKKSFRDNANPHFYVFGGGYGAFTQVANTDVTVGVEGYFSDDEDESTNEQWSLDVSFDEANKTTDDAHTHDGNMGIYGNGYGIGGYTVLGVIGGGYAGLVKNNTNVKLGGTTFVHRVYGGGYGQKAAYDALDSETNITSGIAGYTPRTREFLGEVGGNTRVLVALSKPDAKGRTGGVYGDVFGGGAGVDPSKAGGDITDYVNMGKVLGVTRVDVVENARVYGNVYGGGDVGNVANSVNTTDSVTVVKVRGGDVFGSIFGGGKGRLKSQAADESHHHTYDELGNVYGNSYVIVCDSVAKETHMEGDEEIVERRTISPNVWGDIYGGGEVGNVKKTSGTRGNADVVIEGGNIGGNIYGAGLGDLDSGKLSSANIEGNTVIRIDGGSFLWDRTAGLDGNVKSLTDVTIDKEAALAMIAARQKGEESAELTALKTNYSDIFDLDNNLFLKDHNIYGGGNTVSTVAGNATITVNHGLVTDAVSYFDDRDWLLSSVLKQLCTGNNSHPQFSVLGGGYGINTTIGGNTLVNVQVGKDIDGDGNTNNDDYPNQKADRQTWTDLYNTFSTEYDGLSNDDKDEYYGGSSGANGLSRYETSRLANIFRIPNHTFMNIVGGGMAGLVSGNATVNLTDQSVCQNVFGGGIGIMPASPNADETYTYGQVTGTTTVNVLGGIVKGNVYGGGAGMESYKEDDGSFIDFPAMGAVGKNTLVTIDGTPTGTIIFGKVYGGGDIANVSNSVPAAYGSEVMIKGGCVYQQVFAGGSGCLKSEANDYTQLGKVTGNTLVTVKDDTTEGSVSSPWLWNRVYGGGSYGSVTGSTTVEIQGGHLGYNIFGAGLGDVRTLSDGTESITTSYVGTQASPTSSTINVSGGEWCLSQMWDIENKNWMPKKNNTLSAQFDEKNKKFLINHNMYGGGNAASKVWGNTLINMDKSLLKGATNLGHDDEGRTATSLFASTEWKEVYNKVGSFHFCLIGGGYGEHTEVTGNTTVDVNIPAASLEDAISADFIESATDKLKDNMYTLFKSEQAIMDVIGGGYNGKVGGDTHVTIAGDPFIRRVFGGSFYADVRNTNVTITSACVDDIFAGGMMGDVKAVVNAEGVAEHGTATLNIGADGATTNSKILICHDVYGGNDVSGQIDGQITVDIKGGKIYHNVYGAGNGNYLYALNEERQKVTAVEGYLAQGSVYDLVYEVPRRVELMPASAESSSEAARLVNINSYRPLSQFINLSIAGASSSPAVPGDDVARVKVLGKVFGGGNTATVTKLDGENDPTVTVNIGNYVKANEVFMGADGEAMFDESTTGFLNAFKRINNIVLSDGINWANDPYNKQIPQTYLPLDLDGRQRTFPHIIDLYFQPVEMSIQPVLKWNGTVADPDTWGAGTISNTTVGSFFCGGNRGNMDVTPASGGSVVDYIFPEGLTITNKIVGGCNNANFTRTDLDVVHEGGYLLGSRKTTDPMIRLTVKANMKPTESDGKYSGANVYGGCYKSGSIHGDVTVNMLSNVIDGLDVDKLAASNADKNVTVGSVYGAGYGTDSYVYGDINVTLGSDAISSSQGTTTSGGNALNLSFEKNDNSQQSLDLPIENKATVVTTTYNDTGSSVNNLYGGGELGNVIGNTIVKVLNGHVVTDVVGGSYSGNVYGSTHVLVGYPQYYTLTADQSKSYNLLRADKSDNLDITNADGSLAIKREIRLINGDIISPAVYDAIRDYDTKNGGSQANNFTVTNMTPAEWDDISITIGEAVYGGGYALSSGYTGTGGAGTYTVKKYTDDYNVNNSMADNDPLYNATTKGYGGNTTVLVWEDPTQATEHINISSESADGGFYGDGHLSYAEGFRSGELKGYGYAQHAVLDATEYAKEPKVEKDAAKVMNTIQRLDLMRLTDNCLILNGARDYTINEVSTTPYSIARVGELQMVSSIVSTNDLPTNPTVARYRNYLGLTNNIHYVGAIKSNALFTEDYHDATGVRTAGTSYKAKKQQYITDWYTALDNKVQPEDKTKWQHRNDATAKNLIGISSGYAFKVQNTYTTDEVGTENLFYGPIDGVVEMKLILPISEEGGGYVYADNVHENKTNFLESTGNFVFPIKGGISHYVVDDCLLTNFDELPGTHDTEGKNAHLSEIHYWFLAGIHYQYNLHITGYTYDSEDEPITFHADTSDGLTVLDQAQNDLKITSVTWNHYKKKFAGEPEPNSLYDDDILNASKDYTLKLSASYSLEGGKVNTKYNENGFYGVITRGANTSEQELLYKGDTKPVFSSSPRLAIALEDAVNNSNNTLRTYYDDHLARPDTVVIVLASSSDFDRTYTVNLIINYVKGPSYDGNIEVANCALPGEFVRINKNALIIDSDESFAQNGEFLRIGKLNSGRTGLEEDAYMTYDTSGEKTSDMLKGKVYSDPAGQYILIPAYYFMDGYGVQYVFTCNNMDNAKFAVDLDPGNILEVHNYHHMKPRGTFDVDLHLAEAVTRAREESETFAQPRIYIKDYEDLQAMQAWVDTVGVLNAEHPEYNKVNYDGTVRTVPTAGQYAQFFLQNNITVQQHTPLADKYYKSMANFGGMFHGDGHSITGIDTNLFDNITSTGQVYNLGLESGSIAGAVETGGAIHNSYEYGNLKVYNIDGSATTYLEDTNLEEEFNNGTVAYNLNQYYLEARKYILDEEKKGHATPTSADIADQTAVAYLKDYYANGDYQYARRNTEGSEYLRTDDNPHYMVDVQTGFDTYETFHDKSHPIDEARKVDGSITNSLWTGLSEAESENAQMSLDTSLGDKVATDGATATPKYKPLFNAAKNYDGASTTVVKNDYIFFGQNLQATPEVHPSTITSHEVANMTNRVYRASGFYQSKVDKGFHFNASGDAQRIITYVHDPKTTAIDFTGKRDTENAASIPSAGLLDVANSQKIYYAPALDLPPAFYAMRMDAGVTQNLLVYTDDHTGDANTIAKVAATTLNYTDDTDERDIKGHHVIGTGSPIDTYTAANMHLVDMEDFNAPVQFTATKAWYVRNPSTETGYVNEAGKAWSSVSLPFTVETATLSDGIERHRDAYNNGDAGTQTDITYFYGSDANASTDKAHTILNHEFWLRNMTAVATSAGVTKATFKRPAYSIDGKSQYSDDANDSYRSFAAYKPFIVSFPGSKFYEFNMEGQTITFGADDATVAITDDNVSANATHIGDYYHYGAYLNNGGKTGAYAIKVGDEGDKFVNGEAIYPFRSYITTSATPLAGNSLDADFNVQSSIFNGDYILIGDESSKLEDILDGDIDRDPDGGVTTQSGLHVYGVGQRLIVVSDYATTLPVYTATGALVRVLDVRPGTATYTGFKQGIYVVDHKKIRLR